MVWPLKVLVALRGLRGRATKRQSRIKVQAYNTPFEEALTFILERAGSIAADKGPEEMFSVELTPHLRGSASPDDIFLPLMFRGKEYEVALTHSQKWVFFFTKALSPA